MSNGSERGVLATQLLSSGIDPLQVILVDPKRSYRMPSTHSIDPRAMNASP
jgi:hypothetical protein